MEVGGWGKGEGEGEGPVAKFTLNVVYDRCRTYVAQHFTNCCLDSLKEHLCWCENEFSNKEKPSPLLQMTAELIKPVYMLQSMKVISAWWLNHYLVMSTVKVFSS